MSTGDQVIYLPDPFKHGAGTITGLTKHGWLWITWADGHHDSYAPHTIEHLTVWEDRTLSTAA
jgi:hypothetical protein